MKGFLRLRGNTYYFRCRVPSDLLSTFFTGSEILKSLHTSDKKIAKDSAAYWLNRVTRVFQLCRLQSLPANQLQEIITSELFPSKKKTTKAKTPVLKDLFSNFIQQHKVNWREKSSAEVSYSLDLALDVIGNIYTSDLSTDVIKSYLSTLLLLPANHTKSPKFRNMKISDIIKIDDITPMSRKSVCKHMLWLKAAFKYSKLEHLLDGIILPTVTRKAHEERSVYSLDELQRILDNLKWDSLHSDRLWVPLIGLLQGMRLNEICQLYVDDIVIDELPSICINDEADKQIKNTDSYRRIPIHPKLIELGFLEYVQLTTHSSCSRLFPSLKSHRGAYGHYTGKWFQTFNRKHITSDTTKVFHSLRHGFIDHLANNSEAKEHQIAWLVGHTNSKSQTTGRYTKPPSPAQLLPIIQMYDLWKLLRWETVEAEIAKGIS